MSSRMLNEVDVGRAMAYELLTEEGLLLTEETSVTGSGGAGNFLDVMDELRPHKNETSRTYARVRKHFDKHTSRLYAELWTELQRKAGV